MMYPVDRIVRDVRVCLDENRTSEALFSDGDEETLQLDELIKAKIVEGVKRVHNEAPYHLLEQGYNFEDDYDIHWKDNDTCGFIILPRDFMRLVVFEMDDWERPVYDVMSVADPKYLLQSSRFKGLRGTPQRPVCAIGIRPYGMVLEFYSCKSDEALVSRAVYVPYPKIEDGHVDISERCYDAVVYTVAGLKSTASRETEAANTFFELAKTALQQ